MTAKLPNCDKALVLAIDALCLYANPASYRATTLVYDPPAGWFSDDTNYYKRYDRKIPGKTARQTLKKMRLLLKPSAESAALTEWGKSARYWRRTLK